jgi:hypothetical protein
MDTLTLERRFALAERLLLIGAALAAVLAAASVGGRETSRAGQGESVGASHDWARATALP